MQDRKEHKPWIYIETIDLSIKRGELQIKKNSSKAEALVQTNLNRETNSGKAEALVELTDTNSNKAEDLLEFEDCCKFVRKSVRADKRK